jgi:hypothetical protein
MLGKQTLCQLSYSRSGGSDISLRTDRPQPSTGASFVAGAVALTWPQVAIRAARVRCEGVE